MRTPDAVTVRLHGPLGEKYGAEHRFHIASPGEAIAALDANYPGFRRDFYAIPQYGVLVDGDWRDAGNTADIVHAPVAKEIDFCPMIEGRFFAPIVAGLSYLGITGVAANILGGIIATGLLVGVSMLLSPKPKTATAEDATKDENYIFSGPDNVTVQGTAVPLVYGRCFVGSVVVSAGLEVAEGVGPIVGNNWNWTSAPALFAAAGERLLSTTALAIPVPPPPLVPPPTPVASGRSQPRYVPWNA